MAGFIDTSKLTQRATEAVGKGNFDYAIELYLEILDLTPDDIKTRMALRSAEKAKFEKTGMGMGVKIGAALAGLPNIILASLSRMFKKYKAAIRHYETYLTRNPFASFVLWSLGKTFETAGQEDQAIITYEFLRQVKPKHVKSLRQLARIYVERNDIPRAMQRYQMILQYSPRDLEALKQVHNLAATESIQEGWDSGETFQEKIRDKEKSVRLEQAGRIVRTADQATDAVERVKLELEETPDRPVLWAELGDLQRRKGDLPAATEAFRKALEFDPKNQFYVQKLMDVELAGYSNKVEEAEAAAKADPENEELEARLAQVQKEKDDFWLTELERRVEERPTDTGLRFEIGRVYYEMGKINEATSAFQRVVRDAKYKTQATAMLGKCFSAKGLDELAIEQFEKAFQDVSLLESNGKEIAYNLGILYEKVGNLEAAEDTYKKIFETDIGYLDIAEKMESVYKRRRAEK